MNTIMFIGGTDPNVQGAVKFTTDIGFAGPGSPIQYTIPNLQTGTVYHIWIEAKFEGDDRSETTKIEVETMLATPVVTLADVGYNTITFNWNEIENAVNYAITYWCVTSGVRTSIDVTAETLEYKLTSLTSGERWVLTVEAVSATGKKSETGGLAVITKIAAPAKPAIVHITGNQVLITFTPVEGLDDITYQYAATHVLTDGVPNSNLENPVITQFDSENNRIWSGYPPIWQDVTSSANITLETGINRVYIRAVQKNFRGDIFNASIVSPVEIVTVP